MQFNPEPQYVSIKVKDPSQLWTKPELKKPDRKADFIVKDNHHICGPNQRHFWIKERVMGFADQESEIMELSYIMIDEKWGIFADISSKQNLKNWDTCIKSIHEHYANWIVEETFL